MEREIKVSGYEEAAGIFRSMMDARYRAGLKAVHTPYATWPGEFEQGRVLVILSPEDDRAPIATGVYISGSGILEVAEMRGGEDTFIRYLPQNERIKKVNKKQGEVRIFGRRIWSSTK